MGFAEHCCVMTISGLDRDLEPSCIKRFYLASSATPSEVDIDPATTDNVEMQDEDWRYDGDHTPIEQGGTVASQPTLAHGR